jgi:ribose transport system permease protein
LGPFTGASRFLARLTSPGGARDHDEARAQLWAKVARSAVGGVFVLMVIVFSILKPHNFPTADNLKAILDQAAVFAVVGAGLTVVLTIGEFDLSFDAATALAGSAAVALMVHAHAATGFVVLAAIGVGMLVGIANGTLVAYGRAPAFIGTLAVASVAGGVESWFTKDQPVYEGVSNSFQAITGNSIAGIPITIFISIGCVLLAWVILSFTVYGRRAHAVGSNVTAATLAGLRTKRVRFAAFVFMGAMAGIAGVITTSRAGGSFPNSAQGLLLPTYTAAFLGASALGRRGQFHPIATYFGVIFIGTLQTGLTMVQAPSWTARFVTGLVLVFAVLVALKK